MMTKLTGAEGMKKNTKRNTVAAAIITVAMAILFGPHLIRIILVTIEYGSSPTDLLLLLVFAMVAAIIYVMWLLARGYPEQFRKLTILLAIIFGIVLSVGYLLSLQSCSGLNCLGAGIQGLIVLGIGLLAAFLLSLYYLVRIRLAGSKPKKAGMK